jgi:hypothetical protein
LADGQSLAVEVGDDASQGQLAVGFEEFLGVECEELSRGHLGSFWNSSMLALSALHESNWLSYALMQSTKSPLVSSLQIAGSVGEVSACGIWTVLVSVTIGATDCGALTQAANDSSRHSSGSPSINSHALHTELLARIDELGSVLLDVLFIRYLLLDDGVELLELLHGHFRST